MSENKNLESLLNKIDSALGKKPKENKKDYAEINELKKNSFYKFKPGKNNIIVFPLDKENPFFIWGQHRGLMEVDYYSVQCDAYNNDKDCPVCNVIESLKAEDFKGNKHLYDPIKQVFDFYVPVINCETEQTIAEGPKWLKFGKSIMTQFRTWMDNTDADEEYFFSYTQPQKIVVDYDKSATPVNMYKLDKKNVKPFSKSQIEKWLESITPVEDFMFITQPNDIKTKLEGYFSRIVEEVTTTEESKEDDAVEEYKEVVDAVPAKLDFLKK